ncbi:MAG: winged helix-turn-helix transcriptional regulator, partial [Candidatus Thermoplasmatota archaeon]
MVDLDLKDRKILYELDLNARQSFGDIGKKVGLSKDSVAYRVKRMEDEGVI